MATALSDGPGPLVSRLALFRFMNTSVNTSRRAFVAAALTAVPGITLAAAPRSATREAIERLNRRFEEAHLRGDAAMMARQYTADGQALWGPKGRVTGRTEIERLWKADIGEGGRKALLETYEVEETGRWAYETGRFRVWDAANTLINDSTYLEIWKKVGRDWLIHRDIGSENRVKH